MTIDPQAPARLISTLRRKGIRDTAVLATIESVPRELFVPPHFAENAYDDEALAIECGQTISQPFVVATMTESLKIDRSHRVLEIGTGSGYQTAILARLSAHVFSIEIHQALSDAAAPRLALLGLDNVTLAVGDGVVGWESEAPFDRIIVTAATPEIPDPLIRQLADDGRFIAPVGEQGSSQTLTLAVKHGEDVTCTALAQVRFVPLIRSAVKVTPYR